MDYTSLTDQQLLERVIGITATARHFTGALAPLFAGEEQTALEPLLAAHELLISALVSSFFGCDLLVMFPYGTRLPAHRGSMYSC